MAFSQDCVAIWLFLVVFCATTGAFFVVPPPIPGFKEVRPFDDVKEFDVVGRFAVDEYNRIHMDEPHLFISLEQVVDGEADFIELFTEDTIWTLKLEAQNCSQPGPSAYYIAIVFKNMNNISGGQSLAYGSNYTFGGLFKFSSSMWSYFLQAYY